MNISAVKKTIKKLEADLDSLDASDAEHQDLITEAKLSLLVVAGCVEMLETADQTKL